MENVDQGHSDFFFHYLGPALDEALRGRDLEIAQLRFGLMSGDTPTLAEMGIQFNVTRERIRQILCRCLSRVHFKAKRQLKLVNEQSSCAKLIAYIEQIILPYDEGCATRLVDFCEDSLKHLPISTHAIPLIASLAFPMRLAQELVSRARSCARDTRRLKAFEQKEKTRSLLVSERFQNLSQYIMWTDAHSQVLASEPVGGGRARNVFEDRDNSGVFYSKKLQRNVQYESKLELRFYAQLEQVEDVIWYQEQPFGIAYRLDGYERTYYPDVLVELREHRHVVVEIKPTFLMPLRVNRLKWKSLSKYCAERGWGVLITDGRHTIQQMQNCTVNVQFATEILDRLKSTSLTWSEYKVIADFHNVSTSEFMALVLKAELDWSLGPFKLRGPNLNVANL
jgi:hypothetical protein